MGPASITVIIPTYNAAAFVARAIGTVRAQSLQVEEIIVVDDGSTDDSAALARRLGVSVILIPHGGCAAARSAGLSAAKSDWIALLDADDVWHPRKLEFQMDAIRAEPEIGLIFSDFEAVDDVDGHLHQGSVVLSDPAFSNTFARRLTPIASLLDRSTLNATLGARSIILTSTAMFRRDLGDRIGRFSSRVAADDTDFFMRLSSCARAAFVEVPLTAYMQHQSQVTANWSLDSVRIALYRHVLENKAYYHEQTVLTLRAQYPALLYYLAAHHARNRRFAQSAVTLAKAFTYAILRHSLATLFASIGRGSVCNEIASRMPIVGRHFSKPSVTHVWTSTVHGVEIPWRSAAV